MTTKKCSRCLEDKPLDEFHRHPTASLGRKNHCKICCQGTSREQYLRKLKAQGKSEYEFKGGTVAVSTAKRGDVREDGLVFYSKRKNKNGYQEWWVTKKRFDEIAARSLERARIKYANDPEYRNKLAAANCTEKKRALKRRWNNANRAYMDSYQAARRAKLRGNVAELTPEEKKHLDEIYKFRDILNAVHGKAMFHVDHKKAIARGGKHHPDNARVTTAEYNVKKFTNDEPK